MAKTEKRKIIYRETYRKGTPFPHGKKILIEIVKQKDTVIEFVEAGNMSDDCEFIVVRIDKINARPFFKKESVLVQGLPSRF